MIDDYDVIVVGAGPAGCSAAHFLAQKGLNVILVDKAVFPRDKICGDGISAASLTLLEEMGVLEKIEALPNHKIQKLIISAPNGQIMTGKYPNVKNFRNYGYVVQRKAFDYTLFQHIQVDDNIRVIENFRVKHLIREHDKAVGVKGVLDESPLEIHSRYVVGADGAHSKIAHEIGCFNSNSHHRAFAVRSYYEGVEELSDAIEIHYDSSVLPGYCWIFPTSENSANVGVGVFNRFSDSKEAKDLFDLFIHHNRYAKAKLKNAKQIGGVKGFPLPLGSFHSRRSKDNVLLVGDAASLIDPLTGEGVYSALLSGKVAANAILKSNTPQEAGKRYEKMWTKKLGRMDFLTGYAMQPLLANKIAVNIAVFLGKMSKKRATNIAGAVSHVLPKYKMVF